jgi:hypothetical protein
VCRNPHPFYLAAESPNVGLGCLRCYASSWPYSHFQALGRQADALLGKLGPEYSKLMDGLDQVDPNSSEGKEFISLLSGLDKLCTK